MNWIKENPVPAGIIGAGILAMLAIAFLASRAAEGEGAALDELSRQTTRLESLQRRQPPATDAGLAAAEKSLAEYRGALAELATALASKEEPLEKTTPEKFQDELRKYANSIAETAASKKTTLPDPFLLGFEEFQSQLPPPDGTPELHREFKVVRRLVESLLALGIASIDTLVRGTPAELPPAGGAPAPQNPPQPPAAAKAEPPLPPPQAIPLRLGFTAKQDSAIEALNLIASDAQFLVLRSVVLENTNPEPPPRQTEAPPAQAPPLEILLPGEEPKEKLDVVLGRELVKATLDLEIIDFPEPPAAPPAN